MTPSRKSYRYAGPVRFEDLGNYDGGARFSLGLDSPTILRDLIEEAAGELELKDREVREMTIVISEADQERPWLSDLNWRSESINAVEALLASSEWSSLDAADRAGLSSAVWKLICDRVGAYVSRPRRAE